MPNPMTPPDRAALRADWEATLTGLHKYGDRTLRLRMEQWATAGLALLDHVERVEAALRSFRRTQHRECEDCWYSCPQHPDYCGPPLPCNCGLAEANARIDAALAGPDDDQAAMAIDPNPPGVVQRPFTKEESEAFDKVADRMLDTHQASLRRLGEEKE